VEDNDMDAPVTRREFQDGLAVTGREFREGLAELKAELTAELASKTEVRIIIQQELAHQFKLIQEYFSFQFRAVDDQYTDLPARVTRLEDAVFKPKSRRKN
jgi:hypothetical protein